jgi:hypothetical protein
MRNSKWEAQALGFLKFCDYETFLDFVNEWDLEELRKETHACDAPGNNCHLECPMYRDRKACIDVSIGENYSSD